MYSLMSSRTIAASSSKRNSARARASSVLPTPVGPRKRNDPIGRLGSLSPARARRTASDTATTALSWPITRACSRSSICRSFSASSSFMRCTGMPVQALTMPAMSSPSMVASAMPLSASHASLAVTNVAWILSVCSLSWAARS